MRNTDRTMANIENIPGGFNLLRQQYENVVEPMQQASQVPDRNESSGTVCIRIFVPVHSPNAFYVVF